MADLKASAPEGYAVYVAMKDKKFFLNWITCDDVHLGLETAVHESVHHLADDNDAFPLIKGGDVKRPHEVSKFYGPSLIAKKFDRADNFVSTYLRVGDASSATDFLYMLDELNAYSHDLNAAVGFSKSSPIKRPSNEQVDNRDGLAALMAFVATYIQTAEESKPETWNGLHKPPVQNAVATLWTQAEDVMKSSCGIPKFGTKDQSYIRRFCDEKSQSSLRSILGRAPMCPVECLESNAKNALR